MFLNDGQALGSHLTVEDSVRAAVHCSGSNLATISDGTNSWSLAAPGSGTSQAKCTCALVAKTGSAGERKAIEKQ